MKHLRSLHALLSTQKDKNHKWIRHVTSFSTLSLYLGLIRGIHKFDPCIPRIELACQSSSEVSTVDLYNVFFCSRFFWTQIERRSRFFFALGPYMKTSSIHYKLVGWIYLFNRRIFSISTAFVEWFLIVKEDRECSSFLFFYASLTAPPWSALGVDL